MISLNGHHEPAIVELPVHEYVPSVSAEMQPAQKLIAEIASTDIPVLLQGETGTGKEIVALEIHKLSAYKSRPFMKMSCAALTEGSMKAQIMSFANVESPIGTIFLDEIGELDAGCQRALLHSVLEGQKRAAPGSLDARLISATTRDMEVEAQDGRFRSELLYRVNGVCLRLPPLRRRREDIPAFVDYFIDKYASLFGRGRIQLSSRVMRLFGEHPWPGNIRQLENVVKRIVALGDEELGIADLDRPNTPIPESRLNARSLKAASRAASLQAERTLILETLERTHWNRKRAAQALQISYKSLLFKLKHMEVSEAGKVSGE